MTSPHSIYLIDSPQSKVLRPRLMTPALAPRHLPRLTPPALHTDTESHQPLIYRQKAVGNDMSALVPAYPLKEGIGQVDRGRVFRRREQQRHTICTGTGRGGHATRYSSSPVACIHRNITYQTELSQHTQSKADPSTMTMSSRWIPTCTTSGGS